MTSSKKVLSSGITQDKEGRIEMKDGGGSGVRGWEEERVQVNKEESEGRKVVEETRIL